MMIVSLVIVEYNSSICLWRVYFKDTKGIGGAWRGYSLSSIIHRRVIHFYVLKVYFLTKKSWKLRLLKVLLRGVLLHLFQAWVCMESWIQVHNLGLSLLEVNINLFVRRILCYLMLTRISSGARFFKYFSWLTDFALWCPINTWFAVIDFLCYSILFRYLALWFSIFVSCA